MALNNFTLLYVEDNIETQQQMKMLLEDEVKEFYQAYDGQEGVEIYKEKHPDIIRIKKEIAKLEKEYGSQGASAGNEPNQGRSRIISDPAMQRELINVDAEIARLQAEAGSLKKSIKLYQMRVDNTPRREQELASLKRDYDITLQSYQNLLSRKIEAKMSENLEKKQQGEQRMPKTGKAVAGALHPVQAVQQKACSRRSLKKAEKKAGNRAGKEGKPKQKKECIIHK